jgi:hypothetical protein
MRYQRHTTCQTTMPPTAASRTPCSRIPCVWAEKARDPTQADAKAPRHCRVWWQEDAILGGIDGLVPAYPILVYDDGGT